MMSQSGARPVWPLPADGCAACATLAVFDATAPLDPLAPNVAGVLQGGQWKPPPIVAARRGLELGLRGYRKDGEALFRALVLEPPEKKPAKPKPEKPRKAARNG
jgi:hypothetical protein